MQLVLFLYFNAAGMFPQPLFRALLAIAGLSYLVAVTMGNILFDLMGNSATARSYYCSNFDAAVANPLRMAPITFVIGVTAIALFFEVKAAVGSQYFLVELSMVSAMVAVEIPMLVKCIQLEVRGCSSRQNDGEEGGPWPVHRNLLMSHTCVLLILLGTFLARMGVVLHRTRISKSSSPFPSVSMSSKSSEVSSNGSGSRRFRRKT